MLVHDISLPAAQLFVIVIEIILRGGGNLTSTMFSLGSILPLIFCLFVQLFLLNSVLWATYLRASSSVSCFNWFSVCDISLSDAQLFVIVIESILWRGVGSQTSSCQLLATGHWVH